MKRSRKKKTRTGKTVPQSVERVAFATRELLCGDSKRSRWSHVIDSLMRRFDVARSTAELDIEAARQHIAEDLEKERATAAAEIAADLRDTRTAARKDDDHASRVAANRALMKLHGLEKLNMNVGGTPNVEAAIAEALARIKPDFSKLTKEERDALRPVLEKLTRSGQAAVAPPPAQGDAPAAAK